MNYPIFEERLQHKINTKKNTNPKQTNKRKLKDQKLKWEETEVG